MVYLNYMDKISIDTPRIPRNILTLRNAALFVAVMLIAGSSGTAYYFYNRFTESRQNPQKFAQEESRQLIARVGQLIVLPAGEEPTIATVNDPERLKDQPFFAQAKKGDRVFIYTNARKAILYDPTANKIIEVAPINIGAAPTAP